MSKFEELLKVDVSDKIEVRKSGNQELSYLSWSWAWIEFKKIYPDATYKINKFCAEAGSIGNSQLLPYMYDTNTGYMVNTEVTAEGITYEMWLPVMDGSNKAMKDGEYKYKTKYAGEKTVEQCSMFDVNKAIMRCLVKNLAMFGLGISLYTGEDLPEQLQDKEKNKQEDIAIEERPKCPKCGKFTSKKALENWGMCAECKRGRSNG